MAGTTRTSSSRGSPLPLIYRLFFLTIEPLSALAGAYLAYFQPDEYIRLHTHPLPPPDRVVSAAGLATATATATVPLPTRIVLAQLANLYLLFALNEALVLRATADRRVWCALLTGLLVADVGHLCSVWPMVGQGKGVYWDVAAWTAMDWGNVGFVYVGMAMRVAFLLGVGVGRGDTHTAPKRA